MTYGFHRSRRGIVADLTEQEQGILLGLLQQTAELLSDATGAGQSEFGDGTSEVQGSSDGLDEGGAQPDDDSFEAMMRRAGFGPEGRGADGQPDGSDAAPEIHDSAVRRLLPDAHAVAETAAEFRRMTGTSVRDRKLGHLRTAVQVVAGAQGGRLRLSEEEATSLLIAMTDVRLVLADRLDLDSDEKAESLSDEVADMDQDDPRFALALGYEFLTWLQETLATALTR